MMGIENNGKLHTTDLALIAMFVSVIAICSWISIPAAVPFSLQTLGVFLAVGVLGGKRGTLAVLTYLLLGFSGAPVFSGFSGGIGHLFHNTGGYLIGFLMAVLAMWEVEKLFGRKGWVLAGSMVLGLCICYVFGTVWFMVVYSGQTGAVPIETALTWCVLPYVIPDFIKIALALILSKRIRQAVNIV